MGTLPPTKLLLSRNDLVIGHFNAYSDIAYFLGVTIDDEGQITLNEKKCHPTYILEPDHNGFSKIDAIKDFAYYHMRLPDEYSIYRYLTNET